MGKRMAKKRMPKTLPPSLRPPQFIPSRRSGPARDLGLGPDREKSGQGTRAGKRATMGTRERMKSREGKGAAMGAYQVAAAAGFELRRLRVFYPVASQSSFISTPRPPSTAR